MLDVLLLPLGENALAVFEWRTMRFEPVSAHDEDHAAMVWKTGQNYARLLRDVQRKHQA